MATYTLTAHDKRGIFLGKKDAENNADGIMKGITMLKMLKIGLKTQVEEMALSCAGSVMSHS